MQTWCLSASAALMMALSSAAASAQVTPEEVWQNWQKASASYGQAMVADSVVREGDTLVVRNMQLSMDEDGAKIDGRLDELRFRDLGDGTVEVTTSDTYPIRITIPGEDGAVQELAITINQPGLRMVAGGKANETSYAFDASTIGITVEALENGTKLADIAAKLSGLTGSYLVRTEGESSTLDSAFDVQTLGFTVSAKDQDNSFEMVGNLAGIEAASTGRFLGVAAMEDMAQALRDGFASTLDFRYGAGSYTIDATDSGKTTKLAATNETGSFAVTLDQKAMRYAAGGTGVTMTMSGGDIPFPEVRLSYGEAGFDMMIPLAKSDEPSDFAFVTRIVDLVVSDEIWGMLDPTATLPRDPATLVVDAAGKVRLTADLMDEAAMDALNGAPPGELQSLTIRNVTARAAGAELTGAGDLTFDNTDLATFDGVPAPTGKIDLVLKGGNGLLDKLVSMGLVPAEDAMGVRMMMAMFTRPGEGEDVLNSMLEFKDKGFYANGQRLK